MIKLILLLKNKILFKIKKNGLKEFDFFNFFIFYHNLLITYILIIQNLLLFEIISIITNNIICDSSSFINLLLKI